MLPLGAGGTGRGSWASRRRRRSGWPPRSARKEEGGGRVTFYFDGKVKQEDSPSDLHYDSDSSEDEWWEGRKDGEDAEKENKIKMALEVFTMTCPNFVLDNINPLRILHLDVEGWEAYALHGAGEALRGVNNI